MIKGHDGRMAFYTKMLKAEVKVAHKEELDEYKEYLKDPTDRMKAPFLLKYKSFNVMREALLPYLSFYRVWKIMNKKPDSSILEKECIDEY